MADVPLMYANFGASNPANEVAATFENARAAAMKRAQDQGFAQDFPLLLKNPNAQNYALMNAKYPDRAAAIKTAYEGLHADDQKATLQAVGGVHAALENGRPDLALGLLQRRIDAKKSSGQDYGDEQSLAELIQQDPKAAQGVAGYALAAIAPKEFAANYGAVAETPGKIAKTAADTAKAQADAAETNAKLPFIADRAVADIAKVKAETAKANADAATAGMIVVTPGGSLVDKRTGRPIYTAPKTSEAKPIPPTVRKLVNADIDALGIASSISSDIEARKKQIENGDLSLGFFTNIKNRGIHAVGADTKGSRNFASFRAQMQKLRNDSLRLNAGVQTEGDAIRAWAELIDNLNDPEYVKQRLDEIDTLNQRAADMKQANVERAYQEYGLEPPDLTVYRKPKAAVDNGKANETKADATQADGWSIKRVN